MGEPIQTAILHSLDSAKSLYHRLVLLVGGSGAGKTKVLRTLADQLNAKVININLELSSRLLELTPKQRSLRLPQILREIVDSTQDTTVILDNIELLFDAELKLDPLRLLQGISRNRIILAAWNGSMDDGKLKYAETGHPEYRTYEPGEIPIVNIGLDLKANTATTSSEASET